MCNSQQWCRECYWLCVPILSQSIEGVAKISTCLRRVKNINHLSVSRVLSSLGVLQWFLWVIPSDNFVNVIFVNKAAWHNRKTPGLGIRWSGFQPANCWSSVEPQAIDVFLLNFSFLLVHADLCSSDSLSRAHFTNLSCILGFEHLFTALCSCSVHPSEALGVFSKHTDTHTSSFPWQTTSEGCLCGTLLIHSWAVCSYESKEQFLVSFLDVLQLCGNATVATSVNK